MSARQDLSAGVQAKKARRFGVDGGLCREWSAWLLSARSRHSGAAEFKSWNADKRRVSGHESQLHFGSTQHLAVVGERQLPGIPTGPSRNGVRHRWAATGRRASERI